MRTARLLFIGSIFHELHRPATAILLSPLSHIESGASVILEARILEVEAKKPVVMLNREDALELGVKPLDRLEVEFRDKKEVAIVNVSEKMVSEGHIGLFDSIAESLNAINGDRLKVSPVRRPESVVSIRKKLSGKPLSKREIRGVVRDVVEDKLSNVEITAFVTSLYHHGLSMDEVVYLSTAMAETGKSLGIRNRVIYDKHSIGGVPGDKTSMLLVPTVAAAGLTIPKTSSRAITAPAGTADRMECICPVELGIEEIRKVVEKTNGCLVWGGAVDLSPADDAFIQIEYPLSIDPLLLPSVMSKKKAAGANYVVIDIPTGRGVKIKSVSDAEELAGKFIELGKRMGISVNCVSTFAEQPIGRGIGPALEARELLETVSRGRGPQDLINKVVELSSVLLEFAGKRDAKEKALSLIRTGKSYRKLREIIEAQGGNPDIKADDIPLGSQSVKIRSRVSGEVLWINNREITQIAREAGAPKDKGAGIYLHKKLGDPVRKGDVLFEIFAEKNYKLNRAISLNSGFKAFGIGKEYEMVLAEIPEEPEEREYFFIDR